MKLKKLSVLVIITIFLISLLPAVLAAPKGEVSLERVIKKAAAGIEKTQEKIEQVKERYQVAKERYQTAKERYLEVKEKVNTLRKEIKVCPEENCEPKRKQFRVQSRDVLVNLADVVLNTLDKLTAKIEASDLSEEEQEQLLADLEAQKTDVEEAKAVLGELTENVTKVELKEAIQIIKQAWAHTKPQIKLGLGKLVGAKLGNIVVKVERLETKFDRIRDRLEGQGHDVSALDDYLTELEEKLASAKENWEMSRERFRGARTADDVGAAVQEAHKYQERSREQIGEAREAIRNIVREIKGLEETEETEEEETEEEEEETEEEETEEEEEEETEEEETEEEEEETEENETEG